MANASTREHRQLGLARKMVKGQPDPDHRTSGYTVTIEAPIFKGKACQTAFSARESNPMNKRKSAWKGAKFRPVKEKYVESAAAIVNGAD